jgi:hypothetical protein
MAGRKTTSWEVLSWFAGIEGPADGDLTEPFRFRHCRQSPEHEADHGEVDEGGGGSSISLEILGEATAPADPGEGALDDPALGQDDKAVGIAALDNLQGPGAGLGDDLRHLRPLITGVGEDAFDEREGSPRGAQQVSRTVAVLHVGRVDGDAQQEAQRVDQDVALAAGDFLARIKALRVERTAPF